MKYIRTAIITLLVVLTICVSRVQADVVAFWNFDSNTTDTVKGETLSLVNASLTNGRLTAQGGYATGQGTNRGLTNVTLPTGSSSYTMSAFFSTNKWGAVGIMGWGTGSNYQANCFRTNNDGLNSYWWSADYAQTGYPIVYSSQANHVVSTAVGTTHYLYINGQYMGAKSTTARNEANQKFTIGSTVNNEHLYGTIDNASIYNDAMSHTDIITISSSRYNGMTNWWKSTDTFDRISGYKIDQVAKPVDSVTGDAGTMYFGQELTDRERTYYSGLVSSEHSYIQNNIKGGNEKSTTWLNNGGTYNIADASTMLGLLVGGNTSNTTLNASIAQLEALNHAAFLGGSTLNLSDTGDVNLNTRTINIDGASLTNTGSGKLNITAPETTVIKNLSYGSKGLYIDNDADMSVTGTLSGSGDITVTGSGTMSFLNTVSSKGNLILEQGLTQIYTTFSGTITLGTENTGDSLVEARFGNSPSNKIIIKGGDARISSNNDLMYINGAVQIDSPVTFVGTADRFTFKTSSSWTGSGDVTISGASGSRVTNEGNVTGWTGNMTIDSGVTYQPYGSNSFCKNNSVEVNGTLQFYQGNVTVNALTGTGTVRIVTGTACTFTIGANNADAQFDGTITNGDATLSIVKAGTGTQIFAGTANYTGNTTVKDGTLIAKSVISSGTITINSGAEFVYDSDSQLSVGAQTYNGTGTFTKRGSGEIVWAKTAGTFAMGSGSEIRVEGGLFTAGSNANENWTNNKSDLYVAKGATFNTVEASVRVNAINGDGTIKTGYNHSAYKNFTFGVDNGSGAFSGTIMDYTYRAILVKEGTGTQTFSGINTYTGGTTISAGAIKLSGDGTLGTGAITNNSTLEFAFATDKTIANTISGSGSILQTGKGTTTLTGSVAWSGNTSITDGALAANSVGTGKLTISNGELILGATSSSTGTFSVSGLDVNNGTITFGFVNGGTSYNYLTVTNSNATTISNGTFNLKFDKGDEATWIANAPTSGYQILNAYTDTPIDVSGITLNNSHWTLTSDNSGIYLVSKFSSDAYYDASTESATANWTIDGTNKIGVKLSTGETKTHSGTISMTANGDYSISSGTLTQTGVISGSGKLTKSGAGTLELSATNTYTGGTEIANGTLTLKNASGLSSGTVTFNGGTLNTNSVGTKSYSNTFNVGENGGKLTAATSEYSSFAKLTGSGTLTTNGRIHFNDISGFNGTIVVTGDYTRVNPNSADSPLNVTMQGTSSSSFAYFNICNNGTLYIGKLNGNGYSHFFGSNSGAYTVVIGQGTKSNESFTYSGEMRGIGNKYNLTIKKAGAGTLTFNRGGYLQAGTANSLKEVIVDEGTMIVSGGWTGYTSKHTNGFFGPYVPITINAKGNLTYNYQYNHAPNTSLTINGGTLTLNQVQYINNLTLNSATVDGKEQGSTINGGAVLRICYTGNAVWNVKSGTNTIYNEIRTDCDQNKTFTINISKGAVLDIQKNIAGLSGWTGTPLTVQGTSADNAGTLQLHATSSYLMNGLGTITFDKGVTVSVTGDAGWLASGYFGGSTVNIKNGASFNTSTSHSTNASTINLDNGTLSAVNGFGGYFATINMKNGSQITNVGNGYFRSGHLWNSVINTQYDAGSEVKMNYITSNISMYDVSNNIKSFTLNVVENAPLTISGRIAPSSSSNSSNVIKNGNGILILTNPNNNIDRTFNINAGTVRLEGQGKTGTAQINLNNSSVLEFAPDTTNAITNLIAGTGSVLMSGEGAMTLSNNASTFTGTVTVNNGQLILASSMNTTNNTTVLGSVASEKLITVNEGGELVFKASNVLNDGTIPTPVVKAESAAVGPLMASASDSTSLVKLVVNGGKISNDGPYFNNLIDATFTNGAELYVNNGDTNGAFGFSGTTTISGEGTTTFSGNLDYPHSTLSTFGNTFDVADTAELNISVPITDYADGASSFTKTGEGTMILSAANTYTGTTTVEAGTLKVVDGGSLGYSDVILKNSGVLDVSDMGEQLSYRSVSANELSVFKFTLNKADDGTLSITAPMDVEGATLAGTLDILLTGKQLDTGDITEFDDEFLTFLESNDVIVGQIDSITINPDGNQLLPSMYLYYHAGNDGHWGQIGIGVPEPSTWALLILGAMGLLKVASCELRVARKRGSR